MPRRRADVRPFDGSQSKAMHGRLTVGAA